MTPERWMAPLWEPSTGGTGKPEKTSVTRQQLSKHTYTATGMHTTTEESWEAVFSVWPIPRPFNEDQRDKLVSCE
jgi:hypothetical protein